MNVRIPGRLWRELLLGPAYWRHKMLIRNSKNWTPAQLANYQQQKLQKIFSKYDANVVRTKDHYRKSRGLYDRFCFKVLTKLMRTGGTTGLPFAFYRDTISRSQKERAYLFDIWGSAGFEPFDLRVVYRGNIESQLLTYNMLENCYVISPNLLNDANKDHLLVFLEKLQPFFLHVYPSSLFSLIALLGEDEFRRLPIRGVLAGSESFPQAQIKNFESRFGLKVAHWYGHSEYATLAFWCHECLGYHFYPTYGYTEFVPTDDGRLKIIATSFNHVGTIFVRYDTGDIARNSNQKCPQPFPRVDSIEGRDQEYFVGKDGARRAFGPYLFGIHNEFWDAIYAIQFVQNTTGELIVKAVLRDSGKRVWLEKYLRERFSYCSLNFEYVNEIPKTATGKHRYYVSML